MTEIGLNFELNVKKAKNSSKLINKNIFLKNIFNKMALKGLIIYLYFLNLIQLKYILINQNIFVLIFIFIFIFNHIFTKISF